VLLQRHRNLEESTISTALLGISGREGTILFSTVSMNASR
jgi:hypothetical protein